MDIGLQSMLSDIIEFDVTKTKAQRGYAQRLSPQFVQLSPQLAHQINTHIVAN